MQMYSWPLIESTDRPNFITNDKGETFIEVKVPGFKREDLTVTLDETFIIVKGERKKLDGTTEKFLEEIFLGDNSISDIEATFDNGLLILKLIFENKSKEIKIK